MLLAAYHLLAQRGRQGCNRCTYGLYYQQAEDREEYLEQFEHFVAAFNEYLEKEEKNIDYSNKSERYIRGDSMKLKRVSREEILSGNLWKVILGLSMSIMQSLRL